MKRETLAFAVLLIVAALLASANRWTAAIHFGFAIITEQHLLLALRVCAWAAGATLAALLVNRLIRRRVKRRAGSEAPRLLLDLVGGAIALTAICAVAVIEFGVAPMAAVTTSGVVIAVLGFAVRHMIADLFYGVTLALERPFEIGNWIRVSDGAGDETIGRVDEFTWRAVKLVTRANLKVFVPNSIIATTRLTNFDQPEPMWRNSLRITLGYDVSASQAERVLLSAVARVPESASLPATPEARVVEYEEYGVVWELRFWVPSYETSSRVSQRIHDALLQNLKVVGLAVPRPREEVWVGSLDAERSSEHLVQTNWIGRINALRTAPIARPRSIAGERAPHRDRHRYRGRTRGGAGVFVVCAPGRRPRGLERS